MGTAKQDKVLCMEVFETTAQSIRAVESEYCEQSLEHSTSAKQMAYMIFNSAREAQRSLVSRRTMHQCPTLKLKSCCCKSVQIRIKLSPRAIGHYLYMLPLHRWPQLPQFHDGPSVLFT